MAIMMAACQIGTLREHEKLDYLLAQIPKKAQHGLLMSCDLVLTCIDANSLYIALGSNVGLIFLYTRKDHTVQRFKSASTNDVITCIKLHHGIDDQLAFGTASGYMSVFCMPGKTSMQKKQLQKCEVKDMHKHYVTCLEWSTNGMKLYSGDKIGQVVTTEVDFYQGQCRSTLLLIENNTEIIQLDYKHKILLVSTRQRSFLVRIDLKCQIVSIGTQERKIQGPFGACFVPGLCKTDDAKLYASRPSCRLWLADVDGVVQNTLIFTEAFAATVPEIPLLSCGKLQTSKSEFQFGVLKWFGDREIVTWSNSALVVLDPEANRVVACQGKLTGIVDVAVIEGSREMFLLRRHAEARVIRIADVAEPRTLKDILLEAPMMADIITHKEQNEKESQAELFLQKLTGRLKKRDTSMEHNHKKLPELPEPAGAQTLTSPDLPPVVRLTSPELEGIRLFTGGTSGTEVTLCPVPSADTESSTSPLSSTQTSNDSVVAPTGSAATEFSLTASTAEGRHYLGDSTPPTPDPGSDNIVFSHKMRKHKKRKVKEGLLQPRDKEDDNVSRASASSLNSIDELTISPEPSSMSITSHLDSEGVLSLVNSLLNNPMTGRLSPRVSPVPMDAASADVNVAGSDAEIQSKSRSSTDVSASKSLIMPATKNGDLVANDNHTAISSQSGSSENFTTISSSDSEHPSAISIEPQAVPSHIKNLPNHAQDASEIVDNAMANFLKSQSSSDNVNKQLVSNFTAETPRSIVTHQVSFQDIYSEIEVIEATDPFRKGFRKEKSADDFYSLFLDTSPESPVSPVARPILQYPGTFPTEAERSTEMQDVAERRLANTWSEFTTPANIYSLVVSSNHIWFTDKSENIYYSSLGNPKGIVWRKSTGQANQISVSPSGNIVWRLHRGVVYAGTKISSRHPEGLKWVEAIRDVRTMSVDNDCAWFVMNNGDVMMQRRLSLERPCYKSKKVDCEHKLKHILARHGIVWAITEGLGLLVRTGVSNELPEGSDWELDEREMAPYLFSHVALDNENIGWAIDVLGHIWFCDGVTREQPFGTRRWWQVPLSEYILHDETTLDMIRGLARKIDPTKLSYILSTNRGGLITAGSQGVWLALDFRNNLQVCRGNVQGYQWLEAQPSQMSPSSSWKQICASISHLEWGLVWAQHVNGDMFTFKRAKAEATMIPDSLELCCISVGPTAAWALTFCGAVFVRTGMGPHCPQGTGWVKLDITQLGDAHIVHISCNSFYVWAVEAEGTVYHRIGAKPPSENCLNLAWLAIETASAIVFTQVHTGPLDWMVWAIDNRRLTYVRAGITENMPIGIEWVHVPGIQAMHLALTKTGVWALSPNGEILFRYGITRDRPCGNYWKKIPGTFIRISASANDELWGISTEGQLMQCSVKYLMRRQETNDPLLQRSISTSSTVSEEVDWEIV